jgi:hypothetical protein
MRLSVAFEENRGAGKVIVVDVPPATVMTLSCEAVRCHRAGIIPLTSRRSYVFGEHGTAVSWVSETFPERNCSGWNGFTMAHFTFFQSL